MKLTKTLKWFIVGFVFTFAVSMILLSEYVHIEINLEVIGLYAIISLLVGGIFAGSSKGKTHFGHFPFLLGLVLSFWAGLALFGNFELPTMNKTLWWIIEDITVKRNLAIVWFAGVGLFVMGLRWIGGNLFFLRPFGHRSM